MQRSTRVPITLLLFFLAAVAPAPYREGSWIVAQDAVGSDLETINAAYDGPGFDIGMSCQLKPHIAGLRIHMRTPFAVKGRIDLTLRFDDRPPVSVTWLTTPGQPGTFELFGQPAQEVIIAMDGATLMEISLQMDPGILATNTMGDSGPIIRSIRRGCGF